MFSSSQIANSSTMDKFISGVAHWVTAPLRLSIQPARSSTSNIGELVVGGVVICMASALWISGDRIRSLLGDGVPPRASRAASIRDLGTG